jgi:cyclophilin family peptidyl-prolyl cis-trans isomerase
MKPTGNKHKQTANKSVIGVLLLLFAAGIFSPGCANDAGKKIKPSGATVLEQPINKDDTMIKIRIATTAGDIEAELYAKEAPKTVENFVKLAQKGFYDGIIFHRVIPNFMIQTGDPTGTGMGGPGYKFADEFSPALRHDKPGVLSMANSGPNTNGSQFFITLIPTPWLDDHHSVFGQVTSGMDVVRKIVNVSRDRSDKPLQPVKMEKVVILSEKE